MGADIEIAPAGDALGEPVGRGARARVAPARHARSRGELALRSIDEIPALAVAAALAEGDTVFADLAELRVKESDRIVAIARELRRAGVAVEERPDGFVVSGLGGRPPAGGTVQPEHDHRIAMAGAVLGLSADDETIVPAADIATSFPTLRRDAGRAGRADLIGAPLAAVAGADGATQTSTLLALAASVARKSIEARAVGGGDRVQADVRGPSWLIAVARRAGHALLPVGRPDRAAGIVSRRRSTPGPIMPHVW